MNGSLRQRGPSSWELRAYQGINPDTGKRRYATRTVRRSRAEAQAELELLVGQVEYPRRRAVETTTGELFDQWYATVSRLAHGRASTTLNVYAHAVPGGDRQAAEVLADLLRRAAG